MCECACACWDKLAVYRTAWRLMPTRQEVVANKAKKRSKKIDSVFYKNYLPKSSGLLEEPQSDLVGPETASKCACLDSVIFGMAPPGNIDKIRVSTCTKIYCIKVSFPRQPIHQHILELGRLFPWLRPCIILGLGLGLGLLPSCSPEMKYTLLYHHR